MTLGSYLVVPAEVVIVSRWHFIDLFSLAVRISLKVPLWPPEDLVFDFEIALDEFRLITLGNSVRYYLGVTPVFSKLVVLRY